MLLCILVNFDGTSVSHFWAALLAPFGAIY
jgi:hypothetical protein